MPCISSCTASFVAPNWPCCVDLLTISANCLTHVLSSPLQRPLQHRTFFSFPYLARQRIPITRIAKSGTPTLIKMIKLSLFSGDSSFDSVRQ
jgi:hypothetical protein